MENNNYLNKALFDAQETIKTFHALQDKLDKIIPSLKEQIKNTNPEVLKHIKDLEKAGREGNINKLLEIKSKIDANKGKY